MPRYCNIAGMLFWVVEYVVYTANYLILHIHIVEYLRT